VLYGDYRSSSPQLSCQKWRNPAEIIGRGNKQRGLHVCHYISHPTRQRRAFLHVSVCVYEARSDAEIGHCRTLRATSTDLCFAEKKRARNVQIVFDVMYVNFLGDRCKTVRHMRWDRCMSVLTVLAVLSVCL